ncbi:MAG: TonB-dependent receptor plug domain-containing protein [Burkholderiales bacterium]
MLTNPDYLLRRAFLLALGFGGIGLVIPDHAKAQETGADGEIAAPSVEVSAYRVPTLLSETSQGVSIVTREEIAARNPASMVELMRDIPGLYVDQLGGPGGIASVHIRGSDPEHVLVLVDGVRMNDPLLSRGGSYDLSSLDTTDIERIEVIRGAGSALYGADAMGGVINIVTKGGKAGKIGGNVELGVGGQGYTKAAGSVSGGSEVVRYSVTASKLRDGLESDGGKLDLNTISGSLSITPSANTNIGLHARQNDRESSSFPDFSGGIRLAVLRTLEKRDAKETSYGADLKSKLAEGVGIRVQVSRYEREEDVTSPGVDPFFDVPASQSHTDFTRDSILASISVNLPLDSDLTIGFENMQEKGVTRSTLDLSPIFGPGFEAVPADYELKRETGSAFAEIKSVPTQNLTVRLGMRHDSPENLDSETSPSAGVRYDLPDSGTALKAHYSEGFRPPSFFALGDPLVGNPALKSETSTGYEIGVEQAFSENMAGISLSLFETHYRNLIDFDSTLFTLVNRDKVDAKGSEIDLFLRPMTALRIGLNHTIVKTTIVDSTEKLRNRPEHRTSLNLRYAIGEAWEVAWNTVHVGFFYDSSVPTGDVKMDGYSRTDISAAYKHKRLTATVAVDNLFDEKYEQYVGFTHPGVRVRAGLSASF